MNNKIIEKSFLIHIAIFCILFVVLKNNYGFDIFDETSKVIDEYKVIALEEVDTLIQNVKDNPETYNMDEYEIIQYQNLNVEAVDQSTYYMAYYMPAFYMLFILLLVLIENALYRRFKFYYLVKTYDAKKDKSKDKLREIIREKLNYKYRRISLPKHVAFMCVISYIVGLIINPENELLLRAVNNMTLGLSVIITIFGIRVCVKFFKTRSEIVRLLVIILNVFLSFMIPQMYFIIGFIKSLMTIKIIIAKE